MHEYFSSNYFSEDALARRENAARAKLEQDGISGEDLEQRLQCFRHYIRDHRRQFEKLKERFFFCDLYPENATLFDVTFEDCLRDPWET
jgi:hypothetical protein